MGPGDVEQGRAGEADPFFCVPNQLVVHRKDLDRLKEALGDIEEIESSVPRSAYAVVSPLTGARRVDELTGPSRLAALSGLRVSPRYVFGSCGARAPMAARPSTATAEQLRPAPPSATALTVAVIDTGIVLHDEASDGAAHPWLAGRVTFTAAADEDPLPTDGSRLGPATGHGTLIAGVVLGESPRTEVLVRRTMQGGLAPDDLVAEAITKAAARGVRLFNLSFCGDVIDEDAPPLIDEALHDLPMDAVVVAAAGNFGDKRPVWPAASKRVLAVGAVKSRTDRTKADFSSSGVWVDAYAPGVDVVAPFCFYEETAAFGDPGVADQHFKGWARASGTSIAAAVVTGRIAQLAIAKGVDPATAAYLLLQESPSVSVDGFERPFVDSIAEIVPAPA
ncbi:MAG: S8 family peptidase [Acidimicrobiales bacterium]